MRRHKTLKLMSLPLKLGSSRLSSLGIAAVLVLSILAPLSVVHPQTAHAAALPAYHYTKTFDTSASGSRALGYAVATDAQGNVYVSGVFNGTVTFDGSGGSDTQTEPGVGGDAFLTKYNADGSYGYTRVFDTTNGSARASGVATDSQGNVYITGDFRGDVTFDGSGGSDTQTDVGGGGDTFLTKYNANGSYAFTKTFDTTAGSTQSGAVAIDNQGNVYVTGGFSGSVVFDGTGGSDTQTSNGSDAFLTKYNVNGSYGYTKTFDDSSGSAQSSGVATDSQGNVYITGNFSGDITFDGIGGSDTQTGNGTDAFLTKYNANGSYGYTRVFDTTNGSARGNSVATDTQGNIYVTGNFSGTVVFDGVGGSDSQTSPNNDSFLTKYNANGSYGYTRVFDTTNGSAQGLGVATDSQGNIYVTGSFGDTVIFDGSGGGDSETASSSDTFFTQYQADGSYGWTRVFDTTNGSTFDDLLGGVATDTQGNLYITGDFFNTVVFDGPGGSDSQSTGGGDNMYLTSYRITSSGPVSPGSSSGGSAVSVPGAPNTGYGGPVANPFRVLVLYSLAALVLLKLSGVFKRKV